MQRNFLDGLHVGSTVGELPGTEDTFALDTRAGAVGQLLERRPELPGVLVAAGGEVVSAVSRRYYLDTIGRSFGQEVFNPRPLTVLLRRYQELGGALLLSPELPIPEAVRRGLGRQRELVYEPVVVRGDAERPARLLDFEDLLLADSRLTQLRNAQMRQILGTVREALLPDGFDAERCGLAADYLDTLFDPRVIESLVAKVNPLLRLEAGFGGQRKV